MNDRARCVLVLAMLLGFASGHADDSAEADHLYSDSTGRRPLQTTVPTYPERARRERLEGDVEVCFNVDQKGKTSRVAVRRSTHRIFEKPAMLAIRSSTYYPLSDDEGKSGIKTCRTFRFRLTPVAIEQPQ